MSRGNRVAAVIVASAAVLGFGALTAGTAVAAPVHVHGIQGTGAQPGGIEGTGAQPGGIQGTGALPGGIQGTGHNAIADGIQGSGHA